MFTIAVFFLVLSVLVIIHECGHFFAAKLNGIKVEEFGFGLPPRLFGIKIGETLYSLNVLPFGGFVKVFGEEESELSKSTATARELERSFAKKKGWQKISVLIAGVACNFLLGWVIISYLFVKGVPVPTETVTVEKVLENSPAAEAGMTTGDVIASITHNNVKETIESTEELSQLAKKYAGELTTFEIVRNGEVISLSVTPRKSPPEGQGSLGVLITNYMIKKYSITEAPVLGLIESVKMTKLIFVEFLKTVGKFATLQKPGADIAGPVGIAQLTSNAAKQGIDALLQMVGLLSLNLAVINILPFPALDGGRLMLVLYEMIFKRKINPEFERRLNLAGFAILISLIILITINDIVKLVNGG